jgi:fructokinase
LSDTARLGIDLGGTKVEGVVLRTGGGDEPEVTARRRIPTEAGEGYAHILERVASLIASLAEEARVPAGAPIGVGMPGSVTRTGLVKNSNTVVLNGTPFRADLAARVGRPITFANDANCFALAEARFGAGRGGRVVFGVILGTGVGGGIVVDGRIWEGAQSIAGEWGHTVLDPESDRECYCGQRGCVETFLAGPWVARHYREMGGGEAALPEILSARAEGDGIAERCVSSWLDCYGRAMANLINVLDPDVVVLGGGASRADCLYDEGRARVAAHLFSDELLTPILRHELGDSAGVIGAALLLT